MITGKPPWSRYTDSTRLTLDLQAAQGDFILSLDKRLGFDWWATLTFRNDYAYEEVCDKAYRLWIHKINRKVFGVRYTDRDEGVHWVRATESHKDRRVIHYHALIGGTHDQRRLDWMDAWFKLAGIARIQPYDKGRGARHYVSKYAGKGGEIDYGIPANVQGDFGHRNPQFRDPKTVSSDTGCPR